MPSPAADALPEVRVAYMLPHMLHEARAKLPLIYLPLGPLEWHGPHMAVGMDPFNAQETALALARTLGGVVLPTLFAGTERERDPATLKSLGLDENAYVVGMDFPTIAGLYRSFYFPEELFALMVRGYVEPCVQNGYRFVHIVNGHGAVNHNAVLQRLCTELSQRWPGVRVSHAIAFPREHQAAGAIGHASAHETSLLLHYHPACVDLRRLPEPGAPLPYADFGIVDGDGFCGRPGSGHALPSHDDPRLHSRPEDGRALFEQIVEELARNLRAQLTAEGLA